MKSVFKIDVGMFGHQEFEPYVKSKAKEFNLIVDVKGDASLFTMSYTIKIEGESEDIKKFDKSLNWWRM